MELSEGLSGALAALAWVRSERRDWWLLEPVDIPPRVGKTRMVANN